LLAPVKAGGALTSFLAREIAKPVVFFLCSLRLVVIECWRVLVQTRMEAGEALTSRADMFHVFHFVRHLEGEL
jgi:hypothetical protein